MEISLPSGIITNPRPCRVIWMVPTGRSFCGTSAKMNLPRPSDSNRPSRPIPSRTVMILRRVSWFKMPNVLATCLWLRRLVGLAFEDLEDLFAQLAGRGPWRHGHKMLPIVRHLRPLQPHVYTQLSTMGARALGRVHRHRLRRRCAARTVRRPDPRPARPRCRVVSATRRRCVGRSPCAVENPTGRTKGNWVPLDSVPEGWNLNYRSPRLQLRFRPK